MMYLFITVKQKIEYKVEYRLKINIK
jgi:hypothetical protein